MFDLVRATTKDDLLLSGLYQAGPKDQPAVLHVHGFEGDFFSNDVIPAIASALQNQNAFLTIQTRGLGCEFWPRKASGSWTQAGAHYERLEDAKLDISAWISFLLSEGYQEIALCGHSLGTVKITRYLIEGSLKDKVARLILLAPFDMVYLAKQHTKDRLAEYIEKARQQIKDGQGRKMIPKEFFGFTMSYQTYLSWFDADALTQIFAFHNQNYDFPVLEQIKIPTLMIAGTKDEYLHPSNPDHPEEVASIFKAHATKCEVLLINGAGHDYMGFEPQVADAIKKFLAQR